jgi:hypothetical protein
MSDSNERFMRQMQRMEERAWARYWAEEDARKNGEDVEQDNNCCSYCGGSGGGDDGPAICRMCRGTGVRR